LIAVLAGGVGAARFLRGLLEAVDPTNVVVIGNTGDDAVVHGLHVSPDLDTVVYALAGAIDADRGWGLAGESWSAMESLERYGRDRAWFRLGDRDLGTHLYRTSRRREGATLSEVTAEIASAWGLSVRILPMSDDPIETRLRLADEGEVSFQDYFVRRAHGVMVEAVRFDGDTEARPAPGVIKAIEEATRIIISPSNPILSIAPILATDGVESAVAARRRDVVAISPIVAGAALKGPAARLMKELGHEVSVVGVARLYAPFAATLVVDTADAALAGAVQNEGMACVVAPTIMRGLAGAEALAQVTLRV